MLNSDRIIMKGVMEKSKLLSGEWHKSGSDRRRTVLLPPG